MATSTSGTDAKPAMESRKELIAAIGATASRGGTNRGWHDEPRRRAIEQSVPPGQIGKSSDLTNAVRWLALDAAHVTGYGLVVDGERSRWLP